MKIIRETTLETLLRRRQDLAEARKELRSIEADVETQETTIANLLKTGARCQGKLVASIEMIVGTCRPPWKDIYVDHMEKVHKIGPKAAEEDMRRRCPAQAYEHLTIGYAKGKKS